MFAVVTFHNGYCIRVDIRGARYEYIASAFIIEQVLRKRNKGEALAYLKKNATSCRKLED